MQLTKQSLWIKVIALIVNEAELTACLRLQKVDELKVTGLCKIDWNAKNAHCVPSCAILLGLSRPSMLKCVSINSNPFKKYHKNTSLGVVALLKMIFVLLCPVQGRSAAFLTEEKHISTALGIHPP